MKKLIILSFACLLATSLFAQNPADALRYSRFYYGGTARFQGLGSAMGAVGADYSVAATNPAGLGLFKSSELSISPSFWNSATSADYSKVTSNDSRFNFGLANLGFVFTKNLESKKNPDGLKSITIAFGMNRQNDYSNRTFIEGTNDSSSMLTEYVNILNDNHYNPGVVGEKFPYDIGLAYNPNNNGLIYYDNATGLYNCDAPNGGVYQEKSIKTRGSMNEFNLSLGMNLNDKIYLGATIGIPSIHYVESSTYRELKQDTSIHYFQSLTYNQYLETRGTGVNLKLGVIYRPFNWVRIGAAVHTPTYYGNMRDSWHSSMNAVFDDNGHDDAVSPDGYFDYQMATPFHAIGSLAFIIGNYGLITGEYEYVDFGQARFYSSDESFKDVNTDIKNSYTSPVNVRAGTEWRIGNLRIRGGFGFTGKPYKSALYNGEKYTVSGGLGYRGKHLYSDIAYIWSQTKDNYYLYDPTLVDPSNNTTTTNNVVLTLGVRF